MNAGGNWNWWLLSFFGFLRPDLSPWGWRYKNMFSGWTELPDNKDTELGGSNQEASPLASKNNRLVLVPCSCMEVHPYSYFRWCRYFWGLWVSFVMRDEFSVRVTKITSMIGVSWTHTLFSIFNIFKLNELWSYYQKHLNQIILNCITL